MLLRCLILLRQVKPDQTGSEPGWLTGEISGTVGCFPEAYVEAVSGDTPATGDSSKSSVFTTDPLDAWPQEPVKEEVDAKQASTLLASESSSFTAVQASSSSPLPGGVSISLEVFVVVVICGN